MMTRQSPSSEAAAAKASPQAGVEKALPVPVANRVWSHLATSFGPLQAKLTVNTPGDAHEQEADQVADQVMRMPDPVAPQIQRVCKECEEEGKVQRALPKMEEEEKMQAKEAAGAVPEVGPQTEARIGAMQGGGAPLSPELRGYFEPRIGQDLSAVRLHTGGEAAAAAADVQARAFTVGPDIAFGRGEFSPQTESGKRLLAHELVHTVQQGQSGKLSRLQLGTLQRVLLTGSGDCSRRKALPIDERASVARGEHFTETFSRPASGRVRVTVRATALDDNCHEGNTFGVNIRQCHVLADENLDDQTTAQFGRTIRYDSVLPSAVWNTYALFYLRIYVTCAADLQVRVEELP